MVPRPGGPNGLEAPERVGDLPRDVPRVDVGLRMGLARHRQIVPSGPEPLDDDGFAGHQDDLAERLPVCCAIASSVLDEGEAPEVLRAPPRRWPSRRWASAIAAAR